MVTMAVWTVMRLANCREIVKELMGPTTPLIHAIGWRAGRLSPGASIGGIATTHASAGTGTDCARDRLDDLYRGTLEAALRRKPPSDSNRMILRCAAIWQASMWEERTNQVPKSSASTRDTRPLTTTGDVLWSCWVIADDRPALNGLPRCLHHYFGLHFPVVSSFTSPALHGWSAKAGSVHAASTPPRTVTARSLRMLDPPLRHSSNCYNA